MMGDQIWKETMVYCCCEREDWVTLLMAARAVKELYAECWTNKSYACYRMFTANMRGTTC